MTFHDTALFNGFSASNYVVRYGHTDGVRPDDKQSTSDEKSGTKICSTPERYDRNFPNSIAPMRQSKRSSRIFVNSRRSEELRNGTLPVHAIVPGWVSARSAARFCIILQGPACDGPPCVFGRSGGSFLPRTRRTADWLIPHAFKVRFDLIPRHVDQVCSEPCALCVVLNRPPGIGRKCTSQAGDVPIHRHVKDGDPSAICTGHHLNASNRREVHQEARARHRCCDDAATEFSKVGASQHV